MREFAYKCSSECKVLINDKNACNSDFCLHAKANNVMIFASESVNKAFICTIKALLSDLNLNVFVKTLNDGETVKSLTNVCELVSLLQKNAFGRNDLIVNVGGGTICDLGGFIASIYMRGINYINVPTTLLCAVDACIGGKTAVDINGVKNLIGAFKQPLKVIVYTQILSELSNELILDGLSEIVKYGVISSNFCALLLKMPDLSAIKQNLAEIIYQSLLIKAHYVELDEYDFNERHALNLGHTTAHAIESVSEFKLNHAKSVAIGLVAETKLALNLGLISQERFLKLQELFKLLPQTYANDYSIDKIVFAMQSDKKNTNDKISFVLPNETGVVKVDLSQGEVLKNLVF